jgi:PAS domain S-box-containing protein
MKLDILKKLLQSGTEKEMNTLLYWRVLLVNRMTLVVIAICIFLLFINVYSNLYFHAFISISAVFLVLPVFWINKLRKYDIAFIYFVFLCTTAVCIASHLAFISYRFTDTENTLFFFSVLTIFLLDGNKSKLIFLIVSLEVFALKFEKFAYQGLDVDGLFYLMFVNDAVLIVGFYAFSSMFKNFLKKSLVKTKYHEKVLYSLIDNIPLFIGLYDKTGKYVMVNKRYEPSYLMSRKEIIGKRLRDVLHEDSIDIYEPMLEKALLGEEVEFYEKTRMKNGSFIIANGKYIPVYDENGEVEFVTITVNDVTKLEAIRLELEDANRGKDRLLSIIAHDVKSPLNNFEAILKNGEEKILSKDDFSKLVHKLKIQFEPIKQTIEQLLSWSLKQMKNQESKLEDQNLNDIIDGTLLMLKPNVISKKLTITQEGSIESIFADKNHLSIIFRNILHNAVKFTPKNGEIKILYRNESDIGIVEISDTGVGMNIDLITHILQGKSVESSLGTSKEKGTGLGLSLCVELLKNNNGSMDIESSEGKGTIFRLKLPLH